LPWRRKRERVGILVGIGRDGDVRVDLSRQRRQHVASQLRGLDLHLHLQRRAGLHLHDDRSVRHVLVVLPGHLATGERVPRRLGHEGRDERVDHGDVRQQVGGQTVSLP
jgi:hypothetical protein